MFWLKIYSTEFVEIMKKTTFNFLKDRPFIRNMHLCFIAHFTKFDLTGKESVRGNVNDHHFRDLLHLFYIKISSPVL